MDIFEGTVRDLSSKGLGVVDHPDGRIFFVAGTWPGDYGRFQIFKQKKRYGFAHLVELIHRSEERIDPPCSHWGHRAGTCGGCPWLMADYNAQLRAKQKLITNRLARNQIPVETLQPIRAAKTVLGYRNRAQFKTDGEKIGFVSNGTHQLVDIKDCLVLSERNRQLLQTMRRQLPNIAWQPSSTFRWNFIEIDDNSAPDKISLNKKRPFRQANDEQNLFMKNWLRQKLKEHDRSLTVLELFAGSGNFTEVISQLGFATIIANEISESAIAELSTRHFPGVIGITGNIYSPKTWRLLPAAAKEAQILILDPPREGFAALASFLRQFPNVRHIYYISCDLDHFTTDAKNLTENNWTLKEIQPVDQFPQTPHIELLSYLHKP